MADRNLFTQAVIDTAHDYRRSVKRRQATKGRVPAFMMEKRRAQQASSQFERMSPQERELLLQRVGWPAIREQLMRQGR